MRSKSSRAAKRLGIAAGVLLMVAGLGFLVPYFADRPLYAPINSCINNLRALDAAKQQCAAEHGKRQADQFAWEDVLPYLHNEKPKCLKGGIYTLGQTVTNLPTCSIPKHVIPP